MLLPALLGILITSNAAGFAFPAFATPHEGDTLMGGATYDISWDYEVAGQTIDYTVVVLLSADYVTQIMVVYTTDPDVRTVSYTIPLDIAPGPYIISNNIGTTDTNGNHFLYPFSVNVNIVQDAEKPAISGVTPASPLEILTKESSATQTFAASCSDNVGVTSAVVTMDGVDVSSTWGVSTSGFSHDATLSAGQHTIILTVKDAAGNEAQQTWSVTIVVDAIKPTISDSLDIGKKQLKEVSSVGASYSDELSGIDTSSVKVFIDGQDVTSGASITSTGFTYPVSNIPKGAHTMSIVVKDSVGNEASAEWTVGGKIPKSK
jgi:hypothetical protein